MQRKKDHTSQILVFKKQITNGKIITITYIMLHNYERQDIARKADVNLDTITNWLCFLREVSITHEESERAALGA